MMFGRTFVIVAAGSPRRPAAWMVFALVCSSISFAHAEMRAPAPAPTVVRRPVSPMLQEIRAVLDDAQRTVQQQSQRLSQTRNAAEAAALVKQIERTKLEAELNVLRIQASWARREGRVQLAQRLESAIAEILTPPALGDPRRPASREAEAAAGSGAPR